MARKTLIRPEANPPSTATVTSLPLSSAKAAEAEFRRLHEGAGRELFVQRFSDEVGRCDDSHNEACGRDRQEARRTGVPVTRRPSPTLVISMHAFDLHSFNHGFDERFETWEEHAIDLCGKLVKAREECGVGIQPLRAPQPLPQPHVWPPVIAREFTQAERIVAAPLALAALEQMVAAAEDALAVRRSMLEMACSIANGADIPSTWASGLENMERAAYCSQCRDLADVDEQNIEAIRTLSGHMVYVTGGDFGGDDPELSPIRIEWARDLISKHGAGNDVAAKIQLQKTA